MFQKVEGKNVMWIKRLDSSIPGVLQWGRRKLSHEIHLSCFEITPSLESRKVIENFRCRLKLPSVGTTGKIVSYDGEMENRVSMKERRVKDTWTRETRTTLSLLRKILFLRVSFQWKFCRVRSLSSYLFSLFTFCCVIIFKPSECWVSSRLPSSNSEPSPLFFLCRHCLHFPSAP